MRLHYIALHYITLHNIIYIPYHTIPYHTFHYITLHCIPFLSITLHYMHNHTYIHALMLSIEWVSSCHHREESVQKSVEFLDLRLFRELPVTAVLKRMFCARRSLGHQWLKYTVFLRKTLPHFMNWMN